MAPRRWVATTALLVVAISLATAADVETGAQALQQEPQDEYTCDDLNTMPEDKRCAFALSECASDSWLPYTEWYYCSVAPRGKLARGAFVVALLLLLPLLFTLLGDTAEMYFSPTMSVVAQTIPGMRPRFAGVTFVAMGNGAPDLSANINALRMGHVSLSAGAITGAAMFVQCVVASEVIRIAGGVKCRGATLRDVGVYAVSVACVGLSLYSGRVTRWFVVGTVLVYLAYAAWVFVGDEWHARGRPELGGGLSMTWADLREFLLERQYMSLLRGHRGGRHTHHGEPRHSGHAEQASIGVNVTPLSEALLPWAPVDEPSFWPDRSAVDAHHKGYQPPSASGEMDPNGGVTLGAGHHGLPLDSPRPLVGRASAQAPTHLNDAVQGQRGGGVPGIDLHTPQQPQQGRLAISLGQLPHMAAMSVAAPPHRGIGRSETMAHARGDHSPAPFIEPAAERTSPRGAVGGKQRQDGGVHSSPVTIPPRLARGARAGADEGASQRTTASSQAPAVDDTPATGALQLTSEVSGTVSQGGVRSDTPQPITPGDDLESQPSQAGVRWADAGQPLAPVQPPAHRHHHSGHHYSSHPRRRHGRAATAPLHHSHFLGARTYRQAVWADLGWEPPSKVQQQLAADLRHTPRASGDLSDSSSEAAFADTSPAGYGLDGTVPHEHHHHHHHVHVHTHFPPLDELAYEDEPGCTVSRHHSPGSSGSMSLSISTESSSLKSVHKWSSHRVWSKVCRELTMGGSDEWACLPSWRRRLRVLSFVLLGPLYTALRFSVPLVDPESYSQPWLVASMACCPMAILVYLGDMTFLKIAVAVAVGTALGALTHVLTKDELDMPDLDFGTTFAFGPALVSLVGFLMGVLWIDTLASEVVGVITLTSSVMKLPPSLVGLTLLTWGNSLGDFFGNQAMARRGASSTALTACFAAPLFNMLMSMCLGFSAYFAKEKVHSAAVNLPHDAALGCAALVIYNAVLAAVGILHGNFVPARFYLFARVWYGLYLALAITLAWASTT